MSFSNAGEDMLVTWMFTTTAVTRPTAWFIALHTGDPGEAGTTNEVVVGTDADYVRQAVTFDDPVAGTGMCLSDLAASWTVAAGSAGYTVTHISIWSAATAGTCYTYGPLLPNRVLVASQAHSLNIGEVIAAID